jgi:hypothetical protein
MLKFRGNIEAYKSIDDFKQNYLDRFDTVKKQLTDILGVDCNIELASFRPQLSIQPFYLESFHYSLTCFEYVLSFNDCSSTFDETFIGLTKLCFVRLDKNFNLDSIELQHTDIEKLSNEPRAYSGIQVVYSVPESSAKIIVKHSPNVSHGRDGLLMEEFNRQGTLISVVDEATSILDKLKKAASKADVKLESIK